MDQLNEEKEKEPLFEDVALTQWGPHVFQPDVESQGFDTGSVLLVPEKYAGYIGYEEKGTVYTEAEAFPTYRTILVRVPDAMYARAIELCVKTEAGLEAVFAQINSVDEVQVREALNFTTDYGNYARLIGKAMALVDANVERTVYYHDEPAAFVDLGEFSSK